jgi:hypothetical protein
MPCAMRGPRSHRWGTRIAAVRGIAREERATGNAAQYQAIGF